MPNRPVTASECAMIHSSVHEKLEAMEERIDTRFQSVELNMASGFSAVTTRQDKANNDVTKLKIAEIRRDEREKVEGKMLDRIQTSTRWWTVTAIGAAAVVVTIVDRLAGH